MKKFREFIEEAKDVTSHVKKMGHAEDKIKDRLDKNPYPGKLVKHGGWVDQAEKHFKDTGDTRGQKHVSDYKHHRDQQGK